MTTAVVGTGPGAVPTTAGSPSARIGPNAILRFVEVVAAATDAGTAQALLAAAGLPYHLAALPTAMVDEREVVALHRAALERLGLALTLDYAAEAGQRTAHYLLANRIPKPAQAILRVLPPTLASRVLLGAIGAHAWTFAGSGRLHIAHGHPVTVDIVGGPIPLAGAAAISLGRYYGATFATLYRSLVSSRTRVADRIAKVGTDDACRLSLAWR